MPEDFVNSTFGDLFNFLVAEYNVLPLGMYRFPGNKDNTKPYVYTNPLPNTRLTHDDKIFLLAHTMPDRLLSGENMLETPGEESDAESKQSSEIDLNGSSIDDETQFVLEPVNLH